MVNESGGWCFESAERVNGATKGENRVNIKTFPLEHSPGRGWLQNERCEENGEKKNSGVTWG